MECPTCGRPITDNSAYCPTCGSMLNVSEPGVNMAQVSKSKFYKNYAERSLKKNILSAAVIAYVCAGVTTLANFFLYDIVNYAGFIDVVIILGMGLGIHLARSRVCAIILTAYGVFNIIYMLIAAGSFSGWLIIIAGICGIVSTFKFNKEYTAFKAHYVHNEQ